MGEKQTLNCVELKNEIQAKLHQAHAGMSDQEIQFKTAQKLATSNSPVARLWRSIQKKKSKQPLNAEQAHHVV